MAFKIVISNIILLLLFSCKDSTLTVKQYGFNHEHSERPIRQLNLLAFDDFMILNDTISSIFCRDSQVVLTFDTEKSQKQFALIGNCNKGKHCIKRRNYLHILDDEIILNQNYELSKLDSILPLFYLNPGNRSDLSERPNKAFVQISYSNRSMENFKNLLDKLSDSFEKIDVDTKLSIKIKAHILPPSLPPPPFNK